MNDNTIKMNDNTIEINDYTIENFPKWLKNGHKYINWFGEEKLFDSFIPLTKHLPYTDIIENLDNFINVFNASNEWDLFEYPMSIYMFSLINRNEVIELLENNNNATSKIFLKELSLSLLEFKHNIYDYAKINYGLEFIEKNNILSELKNSPTYDIKYEYIKTYIEKPVQNRKNRTYDKIPVTILTVKMNIFRDGVLEKTIDSQNHVDKIIVVNPILFSTSEKLFYNKSLNFENISLLEDLNLDLNLEFPNLNVLKDFIYNPKKYSKKYKSNNLNIEPFSFIDENLIVNFQEKKDFFTSYHYKHLLEINEFNRDKFLNDLFKFNYSDNILLFEKKEDEEYQDLFFIDSEYPKYEFVKADRNVHVIPFTIKY